MENHKEEVKEREEEEEERDDVTSLTLERVAAAKQFIESQYKAQMKHIQERKERRSVLEKKLASSDVLEEEQINLLKGLECKESDYMRLKRHKICVDDFHLLTIIGRGAFGEAHPWFKDTPWDKLYKTEAAFKPQVDGDLDPQNFMKFDEMLLTSNDLNFVGYTYKDFDAVKGLRHTFANLKGIAPQRQSSTGSFHSKISFPD